MIKQEEKLWNLVHELEQENRELKQQLIRNGILPDKTWDAIREDFRVNGNLSSIACKHGINYHVLLYKKRKEKWITEYRKIKWQSQFDKRNWSEKPNS